MGRMQVLRTSFSGIWKGVKSKFRTQKTAEVVTENAIFTKPKELSHDLPKDEFIKTTIKPPREITKTDKINFRQYLLSKKVDLKITPEEIKTLFAYEGEEFRNKSFEFLCKKLNIPEYYKPALISNSSVNTPMSYDFILNAIQINPNFAEQLSDKALFLSGLRHEFQHYLQNIAMFRHETKGEELISIYSRIASKNVHKNIDHYARNCSIAQIVQIFDEQGTKDIMYMKELLKNNKIEEYQAYLYKTEEDMYKHFNSIYTDLRKTIIDKMGVIKKDSIEGKRAEKMIKDTASDCNYWTEDGNIKLVYYITDIREVEALTAQDMMSLRINAAINGDSKYCYIQKMKETQENMQKQADLNPELKELMNNDKPIKAEDFKKMLTYLYD